MADATESFGVPRSAEMVELALTNVGTAAMEARAYKLAFLLLTTAPGSPVAQLLAAIAERAFRRAGAALGAYFGVEDLHSLLRWKLWMLPADYFTPARLVRHPGLAAYVSVIARRVVIDECRAMDNRARAGIEPDSIESSVDPHEALAAVLDDLDLLQRYASELPAWQAPIVDVLAGHLDRADALRSINREREAAGLAAWSPDALHTAVHRARGRLRDWLTRMPSRMAPEPPLGVVVEAPLLHDWRRFWCARDGSYSLADGGFLVDPETDYGQHFHSVDPLDRLVDVPCMVLLGEPGIGKSTVVKREARRLIESGRRVVLVDLALPTQRQALRRSVERAGATNASPTYIFIDALDEGLAHSPEIAQDLADALDGVDISGVRIRITCRTLEWPPALETRLQQRFGADRLRTVELLPLRRIDVIAAANDHGVDGMDFVREVRERSVASLAIRPLSLRLLIEIFAAEGTLPRSKARLFDEGTLILCSEEGASQRGRRRGIPDQHRRRAIAARLAAASTFTCRPTLARGESDAADALPTELVAGIVDNLRYASYSVDPNAVDDVLAATALFTAQSATTYGWSHQGYREFLAAWYLAQHGLTIEAAERLYFSPGLERVAGPLREVAAWHAAYFPALFERLVECDPSVLLHSDGASVSSDARAQLVSALLARMARYEALDSNYQRKDYQKLAHPDLAQQLTPHITDRRSNIVVRRAAMHIARACGVTEVVDNLIAVMFDRSDEVQAREVATDALASIGGDRVRDAFIGLLTAGFAPDPNDSMRGTVLSFLWPKHIDTCTLFEHLTSPQRGDYLGPYQVFLSELPAALPPADLALALAWVESVSEGAEYGLQGEQCDIIDVALRFAERDDVRAALIRIIRPALKHHSGAWYGDWRRNRDDRVLAPVGRRLIARDLIRLAQDDEDLGNRLIFFDPPLLELHDVPWIAKFASGSDETTQAACGRCVVAIYSRYGYPTDPVAADAVVSVELPAFRDLLRPFLDPIELGSARAADLAKRWTQVHRAPPDEPEEAPAPRPWALARPGVERVEAGELDGWVEFVHHWSGHAITPIAASADWATLAASDRERILIAALRYVQGADAPDLTWLDVGNSTPWSAVAARAALQLLASFRSALLDAITEPAWRRWCPVLVATSFPSLATHERAELVRRCILLEELPAAIARVGRRDIARNAHVSVLSELPDPLPPPLHTTLLAMAPELPDVSFEQALDLLVRADNEQARELARATLREGAPERAARAAKVVLATAPDQWHVVVERIRRERAFVDAFAPLVAYREDMRQDVFVTLSDQGAAEICLTLLRAYAPDDKARGASHMRMLTHLDYIERLRRRLMDKLVRAGTANAIHALEWLRDQEPHRDELRYSLALARQAQSDVSWVPLTLDELWQVLSTDESARAEPVIGQSESLPAIARELSRTRSVPVLELLELLANVHVLIGTATDTETTAVHAAMNPLPGQDSLIVGSPGVATYTIGMLGRYAIAHFQSGMGSEGPDAAQLATNDAIVEVQPTLVILVGIAFGLRPAKQRLGDVLVAEHVTSYGMVKLKPDSIEERGSTLRADTMLVERVRAHGRTWKFPLVGAFAAFHVGQVVSGPVLVNNREFRDALGSRFPSAIGGEMEGIGAYGAAFRKRVPVLLVKGICDWADGTKDDHAQPFAAAAATDLLRHVLDQADALAALGVPMLG
ncbi:MAG: hypothetical protein IPH44_38545 [Myxococcales bacterium]|nr:hypothetical protein [Myxococcales bacterium]MBK7197626.1 hypothetical protein [Myxococcales bacterium]